MAGMFELFTDSDDSFRFQLTAPDGTVMALSKPFPDKPAAVAGDSPRFASMPGWASLPRFRHRRLIAPPVLLQLCRLPCRTRQGMLQAKRGRSGESSRPDRSAPSRQPKTRITSAARALGGRAVSRKQQILVRWRQSLRPEAAVADFRPC